MQARIAASLDLAWPNSASSAAAEIVDFPEQALRHFDSRHGQSTERVGPLAIRLWQVAAAGAAGN